MNKPTTDRKEKLNKIRNESDSFSKVSLVKTLKDIGRYDYMLFVLFSFKMGSGLDEVSKTLSTDEVNCKFILDTIINKCIISNELVKFKDVILKLFEVKDQTCTISTFYKMIRHYVCLIKRGELVINIRREGYVSSIDTFVNLIFLKKINETMIYYILMKSVLDNVENKPGELEVSKNLFYMFDPDIYVKGLKMKRIKSVQFQDPKFKQYIKTQVNSSVTLQLQKMFCKLLHDNGKKSILYIRFVQNFFGINIDHYKLIWMRYIYMNNHGTIGVAKINNILKSLNKKFILLGNKYSASYTRKLRAKQQSRKRDKLHKLISLTTSKQHDNSINYFEESIDGILSKVCFERLKINLSCIRDGDIDQDKSLNFLIGLMSGDVNGSIPILKGIYPRMIPLHMIMEKLSKICKLKVDTPVKPDINLSEVENNYDNHFVKNNTYYNCNVGETFNIYSNGKRLTNDEIKFKRSGYSSTIRSIENEYKRANTLAGRLPFNLALIQILICNYFEFRKTLNIDDSWNKLINMYSLNLMVKLHRSGISFVEDAYSNDIDTFTGTSLAAVQYLACLESMKLGCESEWHEQLFDTVLKDIIKDPYYLSMRIKKLTSSIKLLSFCKSKNGTIVKWNIRRIPGVGNPEDFVITGFDPEKFNGSMVDKEAYAYIISSVNKDMKEMDKLGLNSTAKYYKDMVNYDLNATSMNKCVSLMFMNIVGITRSPIKGAANKQFDTSDVNVQEEYELPKFMAHEFTKQFENCDFSSFDPNLEVFAKATNKAAGEYRGFKISVKVPKSSKLYSLGNNGQLSIKASKKRAMLYSVYDIIIKNYDSSWIPDVLYTSIRDTALRNTRLIINPGLVTWMMFIPLNFLSHYQMGSKDFKIKDVLGETNLEFTAQLKGNVLQDHRMGFFAACRENILSIAKDYSQFDAHEKFRNFRVGLMAAIKNLMNKGNTYLNSVIWGNVTIGQSIIDIFKSFHDVKVTTDKMAYRLYTDKRYNLMEEIGKSKLKSEFLAKRKELKSIQDIVKKLEFTLDQLLSGENLTLVLNNMTNRAMDSLIKKNYPDMFNGKLGIINILNRYLGDDSISFWEVTEKFNEKTYKQISENYAEQAANESMDLNAIKTVTLRWKYEYLKIQIIYGWFIPRKLQISTLFSESCDRMSTGSDMLRIYSAICASSCARGASLSYSLNLLITAQALFFRINPKSSVVSAIQLPIKTMFIPLSMGGAGIVNYKAGVANGDILIYQEAVKNINMNRLLVRYGRIFKSINDNVYEELAESIVGSADVVLSDIWKDRYIDFKNLDPKLKLKDTIKRPFKECYTNSISDKLYGERIGLSAISRSFIPAEALLHLKPVSFNTKSDLAKSIIVSDDIRSIGRKLNMKTLRKISMDIINDKKEDNDIIDLSVIDNVAFRLLQRIKFEKIGYDKSRINTLCPYAGLSQEYRVLSKLFGHSGLPNKMKIATNVIEETINKLDPKKPPGLSTQYIIDILYTKKFQYDDQVTAHMLKYVGLNEACAGVLVAQRKDTGSIIDDRSNLMKDYSSNGFNLTLDHDIDSNLVNFLPELKIFDRSPQTQRVVANYLISYIISNVFKLINRSKPSTDSKILYEQGNIYKLLFDEKNDGKFVDLTSENSYIITNIVTLRN